jgi:phytoene dehydrogenase-like protein
MPDPDAVVIGSGPNGLVAANVLADEGWTVLVLEAQAEPGGAVRSAELTQPGFVHDLMSAFYPLAAASPALRVLDLEAHGLRWRHTPLVVAHPLRDGSCVALSRDLDETAAFLDADAPGDGDAWRRLYDLWRRAGPAFTDALFGPFPPVLPAARLAAALGPAGLLRFARFGLLPVRRLAAEEFRGPGAANLLAGNALHSDLTPDSAASGLFGWLLLAIGQQLGWPVPEGGAGRLSGALVRRLEARGGRVACRSRVSRIVVRHGRAVGVVTDDGREVGARRAVLADVGAPRLYLELVGAEHLPPRLLADLRRFQYDHATVKVDWALDGPLPWAAEPARRAGTVHVAEGMDALTVHASELARDLVPNRPFLLLGQYASGDPTRAPAGKETAWAYTHVPQRVRGDAGGRLTGAWSPGETEAFVERMEDQIEALAPGFRGLVRARHVLSPRALEERDENLVGGAVNGGTAQLHQLLVFRPTPGLGRAETPVRGLYLASASAHPSGGTHGACGANAARAALARHRAGRLVAVGAAAGALGAAGAAARRRAG